MVGSTVVTSVPVVPSVESAIGGVLFLAESSSTVTHPIRRASISAVSEAGSNFMAFPSL